MISEPSYEYHETNNIHNLFVKSNKKTNRMDKSRQLYGFYKKAVL